MLFRSVRSMEFAREILRGETGGDPKVVLLASLLHEVGVADEARRRGDTEEVHAVRRILEEASVHWSVIDRVCRLVGCQHTIDGLDTPEAKAAWDADSLAGLFTGEEFPDVGRIRDLIEKRFKTKTGKEIAHREMEKRNM